MPKDDENAMSSLLPSELILKILDIAAASSMSTALALCLVSSWTRKIAQPRLLDTVEISTMPQLESFHRTLRDSGEKFGMVHRLWLSPAVPLDNVGRLVNPLTHLADLAIGPKALYHYLLYSALPLRLSAPQTRAPRTCDLHLTLIPSERADAAFIERCTIEAGRAPDKHPALLRSVTHLSYAFLRGPNNYIARPLFSLVVPLSPLFPRLTHIAIYLPRALLALHDGLQRFCSEVERVYPSLQALVFVLEQWERTREDLDILKAIREGCPRVRFVDADPMSEPLEAWLNDVKGMDSIWDCAAVNVE
ncbi:hypothetical protein PLICRDRAFT_175259 [Plicaturopsis crispa FD-325 SS-3]|nr:hypothetical protein PLICRDRAFT_175259 [Plicaturopsis crispa FD-325 SS-3]